MVIDCATAEWLTAVPNSGIRSERAHSIGLSLSFSRCMPHVENDDLAVLWSTCHKRPDGSAPTLVGAMRRLFFGPPVMALEQGVLSHRRPHRAARPTPSSHDGFPSPEGNFRRGVLLTILAATILRMKPSFRQYRNSARESCSASRHQQASRSASPRPSLRQSSLYLGEAIARTVLAGLRPATPPSFAYQSPLSLEMIPQQQGLPD